MTSPPREPWPSLNQPSHNSVVTVVPDFSLKSYIRRGAEHKAVSYLRVASTASVSKWGGCRLPWKNSFLFCEQSDWEKHTAGLFKTQQPCLLTHSWHKVAWDKVGMFVQGQGSPLGGRALRANLFSKKTETKPRTLEIWEIHRKKMITCSPTLQNPINDILGIFAPSPFSLYTVFTDTVINQTELMFSKYSLFSICICMHSYVYTYTPIYTHRKEVGMSWVPLPFAILF